MNPACNLACLDRLARCPLASITILERTPIGPEVPDFTLHPAISPPSKISDSALAPVRMRAPLLDVRSAKCRYIPRPYMMQPTGSWNSNAASSRKEQNLSRFNT